MTKKMTLYLIDETEGILDEVQAWYLAKADNEGWVYTSVLRQLVNRLYRDRDYQAKRQKQGKHTAYDYALDRDQRALAWAIRALVRHVPADEKQRVEPPRKPRKPSRRLSPAQKRQLHGPSWNGTPKRDWDGPDLPPLPESPADNPSGRGSSTAVAAADGDARAGSDALAGPLHDYTDAEDGGGPVNTPEAIVVPVPANRPAPRSAPSP